MSSMYNAGDNVDSLDQSFLSPDSSVRIIRRYQNRKLYDTGGSSYVTLNRLAEMIREGYTIHVMDNHSKLDITSVTLAQIVFESERKAQNKTSAHLLHEIIRTEESTLGNFLGDTPAAGLSVNLASAVDAVAEVCAAVSS